MRKLLLASVLLTSSPVLALGQIGHIVDAYPDKARYSPSERIFILVELRATDTKGDLLTASLQKDGINVGHCEQLKLGQLPPPLSSVRCEAPQQDFQRYLVEVSLIGPDGRQLSTRTTAVDVSSDWKRFPRYGYLAHYNQAEGASLDWITELDKFHLNGLQFYDFQYRHDQPLAGTVAAPAAVWHDIAGREIDRAYVDAFIRKAHDYNMMAMAYNASYSS